MTRVIARLLRGGFRLVLGLAVAISVAYALLWLLEAARKQGAFGGHTGLSNTFWLDVGLAVPAGIILAIACDRTWMRVRGLGPKLNRKR